MSREEARASADSGDAPALSVLAAESGVAVDDARSAALLAYCDLLLRWGARINLTGARDRATLIAAHLPDAFALARLLTESGDVVDVGSGGGLPALPLALLRPTLTMVLCEPTAKKVAFLRTAIRELGLGERVQVHATRAEALIATKGGQFDVAMSRATLPPADWLALGERLVRPGGRVLALVNHGVTTAPTDIRHPYLGGRRVVIERSVPRGTSASPTPRPPGV